MRTRHLLITCALLLFFVTASLVAPTTHAQRGSAIDTYAITNAHIVPVSGPEIARGTVVIRNGLIAAVGANVAAPADARVIDGTGLTVYPGLIDANTSLGMPQPSPSPSAATGRSGAGLPSIFAAPQASFITAQNSAQPPGLQPEVMAENVVQTTSDQIDAERNAGITSALTAPREGIFIGQSAFINLAGETPRQMIVRSPVAMHIGFTPLRSGTYPGSLMGVFSAIRQMLLDAERYRDSHVTYEQNPRGTRRPTQDRSLAALVPVITRDMPVIMQANTEREIRRALDLAQEFNLKVIIAGGEESWKVTDRLHEMNVPVLLSLNFPRRTTAQVAEADPEPLRVLRERVEAPKAAGRLAAAHVRFAFQSGSMADMRDFLVNAIRAIENGLSRDEALRAMTINAAEILGVGNQLGSIEVGKIANLTVTRGDLFDRNARITNVFIDGRPVELRPVTAAQRGAGASGSWTVNIKLEGRDVTITLILQQEGENLRGSIQGELGSSQIASASAGPTGDLRITVPVTFQGQTHEATFSGRINGNEMSGSVTVVGISPGTFTGTRAGGGGPPAAPSPTPQTQPSPTPEQPGGNPPSNAVDISGTYNLTLTVGPTNTVGGTLLLRQQGRTLSGTLETPFGTTELVDGSIGANGFRFISEAEVEGRVVQLTVTGIVKGNEINGSVTSEIGSTVFTGTRSPKETMNDER
ncbi:MAG: amidohydrolase family protein [Acidobacteriota bacterium]|nr:amidohydrolase family protein [Acidobacteriota bacterium]